MNYQFKYQPLSSENELLVTCVVPHDWLSKNLPTMEGSVLYVDKSVHILTFSEFIFEFFEESGIENEPRYISLSVKQKVKPCKRSPQYKSVFKHPIKFHCSINSINEIEENIVLLNHMFGSMQFEDDGKFVATDFDDVLLLLSHSNKFNFEYAVGDTPQVILPDLLKRFNWSTAKCSFGAVFSNETKMLVSHYKQVLTSIRFVDGVSMTASMNIDNEVTLVSVLVGS